MGLANPIAVVPATADAATAATQYYGYNFVNTTGSAITLAVYDGTDATGILISNVVVPANGSVDVMYPRLIPLTSGSVYVNWTTGLVGSIRVVS